MREKRVTGVHFDVLPSGPHERSVTRVMVLHWSVDDGRVGWERIACLALAVSGRVVLLLMMVMTMMFVMERRGVARVVIDAVHVVCEMLSQH